MFFGFAQMPFSDQSGDVASTPEHVGQCALIGWQPDHRISPGRIEFVAEPGLISPGVEPGPRWAAHCGGYVSIGESYAALSKRIQVRGVNDF